MSVTKEAFGTAGGREAALYTITNGKTSLSVTDFGACIVRILVPDRTGTIEDCVLGYDSVDGYTDNPCFFGAVITPSANRIGGASLEIAGKTYQLPVNDGENNLHTDHEKGSHKRFWDAETGENAVTFRIRFADGDLYLPGNRDFAITYSVPEDGTIRLHYHGTSDCETFFNPTNHAYFNLSGGAKRKVYDTEVQMNAAYFTEIRKGSIPTGTLLATKGTPMDFATPRTIGRDIDADYEQLRMTGGYDHNFVIDGWTGDGAKHVAAKAFDPESGREMTVSTTLPGFQFYAANFVDVKNGKGGKAYGARDAFCFETQYYPDCAHHANFPQAFFGPDHPYDSETDYIFTVR